MAARFITFEGGEGAGKSTQARLLADALTAWGFAVELTREPGGTSGAEAIRGLLLDPDGDGWKVEAEALLFAAARADHVARRILPALDAGKWVICDRYIDSTRAYQGGAGGLNDADLMELHRIGCGGLLPALTLLIEVPASLAASRLAERDCGRADAIGGRDASYHRRVSDSFAKMAADEPRRFARIDGSGTPPEIHERVLAALRKLPEFEQ